MSASECVVLITGCSMGGLGAHFAEEFSGRGCKVYATARQREKMSGLSSGIEQLELDVLSDDSVQKVVEAIIRREGRIDILINNAGMGATMPILDVTLDRFTRTFDTNVFSIVRMSQAVVPHMAGRKSGLVINVGSIAGIVATPFSAGYGASKAAVRSLSDTLDMELRPLNVRVMLIEPGAIKSNMGNNNVATFEGLPSTSLYKTFETAIITRLTLSQGPKATPSAVFAKEMVDRALQVTPPRYFSSGHASTIAWIGSCLPRSIWLDYSWNVYSKMNKPL